MESPVSFVVHNRTRGGILATKVQLADTPHARRVGLLTRRSLGDGEGLWIYPTKAIHTIGMCFSIDVAFLDRRLCVVRMYHALPPYRLTRFVWSARSVLELPSGFLAATETTVGDELRFSPWNEQGEGESLVAFPRKPESVPARAT